MSGEEKSLPIKELTQKVIEKILDERRLSLEKPHGRSLPSEKIEEILKSYSECNGNSLKASEKSQYSVGTILKYWRMAGFEINKPGQPRGHIQDSEKHERYISLINKGLNQTQIAEEMGVSRQNVSEYIHIHDLDKPSVTRSKERSALIKKLVDEGKTRGEIAKEIGIGYRTLVSYLRNHKELPQPEDRSKGEAHWKYNSQKREDIKQLIERGLNKTEIARVLDDTNIWRTINTTPELKETYLEYKDTRKQRRKGKL